MNESNVVFAIRITRRKRRFVRYGAAAWGLLTGDVE